MLATIEWITDGTMKINAHSMLNVCLIVLVAGISGCSNPIIKNLSLGGRESTLNQLAWTQSYEAALQMANETGKPILANFTGSDWCHWCKQLHREVFNQPEFAEWAAEHVVLLELDFPQQSEQDESLRLQNDSLAKQYSINSYPTVVILTAQGSEIGRLGYVKGGPRNWIEAAQSQMSVGNAQ